MTGGSHKKAEITAEAVARGDRAALARAITLMESRRPDHREAARRLLQELMPRTGKAVRIGLTGVGRTDTVGCLPRNSGRRPGSAQITTGVPLVRSCSSRAMPPGPALP